MRIFAADIGGTYSRFGLFETESSAAGLHCLAEARISSSVPTFGALLDRLSSTCAGLSPDMADAAALAVAEHGGAAPPCAGHTRSVAERF